MPLPGWRRGLRPAVAAWLALLVLAQLAVHGQPRPESYKSIFNKTCKYGARNVSRTLFKEGIDGGFLFIMPLESSMVVMNYPLKPWEACFGPAEPVDLALLRSGRKLPCFYRINQWHNFDYWEENACDVLVRSNCYCYAISRYVGSYCEPGLASTGRGVPLPVRDCSAATAGVLADGGKAVDRWTVYNKPPSGHYIALAVKPPADAGDTGDWHFWRRDADGSWSYKAGDTLSRNTWRNGSALRDVEAPGARGAYSLFCGYFEVWPQSHKLRGNNYYFSNLPARYKLWKDARVTGTVSVLPSLSAAWLAAYRGYYADAGWEDGLANWSTAKERGPDPDAQQQQQHGSSHHVAGQQQPAAPDWGSAKERAHVAAWQQDDEQQQEQQEQQRQRRRAAGPFRRPPHTYSVPWRAPVVVTTVAEAQQQLLQLSG